MNAGDVQSAGEVSASAAETADIICMEVGGEAGSSMRGAVGVNALLHMLLARTESLEAKAKAAATLGALSRLNSTISADGTGTKWTAAIMRGKSCVPALLSCVSAISMMKQQHSSKQSMQRSKLSCMP